MNQITSNIKRLKTTGKTRFHEPVKISKEEKEKHIHPRRLCKVPKDERILN